jgi:hypothetical protein
VVSGDASMAFGARLEISKSHDLINSLLVLGGINGV